MLCPGIGASIYTHIWRHRNRPIRNQIPRRRSPWSGLWRHGWRGLGNVQSLYVNQYGLYVFTLHKTRKHLKLNIISSGSVWTLETYYIIIFAYLNLNIYLQQHYCVSLLPSMYANISYLTNISFKYPQLIHLIIYLIHWISSIYLLKVFLWTKIWPMSYFIPDNGICHTIDDDLVDHSLDIPMNW